jgi:hypothetical protein
MVDFIKKFVKTKKGKQILSVILGFGLATLFRVSCKGKNCTVFRAAPIEKVKGIYSFGSKCFSFTPNSTKCNGREVSV